MKLAEALFREPWKAYQVTGEYLDDRDGFEEWSVQPLRGATLAEEDVEGPFEGLFIVAAQVVSRDTAPRPCYLDLVLPERIAENHFVEIDGRVTRRRGRRVAGGTVIPSIGIEKNGVYTLFLAKENPAAGIDVLRSGMPGARHREDLALDLAYLLRDEKRYEEAIDEFTFVLEESRAKEIFRAAFRERLQLYAAVGQHDKADAATRTYDIVFRKKFGHPPGPQER